MEKRRFFLLFALALSIPIVAGCAVVPMATATPSIGKSAGSTIVRSTLPQTSMSTENPTPVPSSESTPEPTPEPTPAPTQSSDQLEGEFIVVNLYTVTTIYYHRAVRTDGGEIFLLDGSDAVPYAITFNVNTGLRDKITFYLKGRSFLLKLSVNEYAYGTALEETYLDAVGKTVWLGRSGIRIRLTGHATTRVAPGLQGLTIFSVSACEIL
jgi:hypothetical protein